MQSSLSKMSSAISASITRFVQGTCLEVGIAADVFPSQRGKGEKQKRYTFRLNR